MTRRAGNDTLFAASTPHRRHPCTPFAPFALLAAALALIAGAPGASAQTADDVELGRPDHSLTRDVLSVWAKNVEAGDQGRVKFEMLPKHPSAPPGRSMRCATAWSMSRS